jgi:hypothetical protein
MIFFAHRGIEEGMRKPAEVQEAKELMKEAMEWGTFKWLFEKTRVRQTADRANEALDRLERSVKAGWSDEAKASFKKLSTKSRGSTRRQQKEEQQPTSTDPEIIILLEQIVEADDEAERARLDAEETFDQAERQMSTDLAQEGCKKAIRSWELHEKAIRKAETVPHSASSSEQ